MNRPLPQPPGLPYHLSRAVARDNFLNPDEQAVRALNRAIHRDNGLNPEEHAERMRGRRLPEATPTPGGQVSAYRPLLEREGWPVEVFDHPLRGRLEAFHPAGAVIMLTADRRRSHQRGGIVPYVLTPDADRWLRTNMDGLTHFATHLVLPPAGMGRPVWSKCRCHKVRYLTDAAATTELGIVAAQRTTERRERRTYRCEADDRVWHLTSRATGYTEPTPLAWAYR